jgi:hypothetical protein
MMLRDMTEADLDILFDIQDDDIAQYMAGFTSPDGGDRDSYVARQRGFLADDKITKKVILADDEIVGSVASFVVEGDTEVTYWIRRDLWAAASPRRRSASSYARSRRAPSSRGPRPTTPARRRSCSATGSRR